MNFCSESQKIPKKLNIPTLTGILNWRRCVNVDNPFIDKVQWFCISTLTTPTFVKVQKHIMGNGAFNLKIHIRFKLKYALVRLNVF